MTRTRARTHTRTHLRDSGDRFELGEDAAAPVARPAAPAGPLGPSAREVHLRVGGVPEEPAQLLRAVGRPDVGASLCCVGLGCVRI